jgi:hypothetical protein
VMSLGPGDFWVSETDVEGALDLMLHVGAP